jgi:cytochrome c oxidase subunit 3/cytochrome o ubiquinol oxidase subunit 3
MSEAIQKVSETTPGADAFTAARQPVLPALPTPPTPAPEKTLSPYQWGMLSFLLSEVAFFSTLIVAYVSFIGKDVVKPTPAEALSLGLVIVTTICLLSSSGTIHLAEKSLHHGSVGGFRLWWSATILLGVAFLLGTGYEWYELIERHHLTISRNLFGTTFFTLVGFHGLHVTGGVIVMAIVLGVSMRQPKGPDPIGVEMTAWYWHFVDVVWIAVFTVVYLVGR